MSTKPIIQSLNRAILLALMVIIAGNFSFAQNSKDELGKKQGHWVIMGADSRVPGYKPDQKVEEGDYKDNGKVGIWTTYYSNGNKKSEITFTSGRPSGPYTTYYSNGKTNLLNFLRKISLQALN